jgi:thiol:disulfide interchange protein DsbC
VALEVGKADSGAHDLHNQKIIVIVKGDFIFPEAVDTKKNVSLKTKIQDKIFTDNLGDIYKNEAKSNIISLGDPKKPAVIIFSDPECQYCRQELANIENRLKTNSVKIILTPFGDFGSIPKSALIYKESSKVKTDKQKIALLRKYYDENAVATAEVSDDEMRKIDQLRQKYFSAGLGSVPLIVEESGILDKKAKR